MRGLHLKGLDRYPDLKTQRERLLQQGWKLAENKTIWELETKFLPPSEIARINRIEQLDEIEEWRLLSSHYAVLVALTHRQAAYTDDELACLLDFSAV